MNYLKILILSVIFMGCNVTQSTQTETILLTHVKTELISESPVVQLFKFEKENGQTVYYYNSEISQHYNGSFHKGKQFQADVVVRYNRYRLQSLRPVKIN